jgi:hypothetical protein
MASNGNFCTMNPLVPTSNTMVYTFGNLRTSPSSSWSTTDWCRGNTVIPSDKKIYFECLLQAQNIQYNVVGIATNLSVPSATTAGGTGSVTIHNSGKYVNGTYTGSIFALSDAPQGAILQVAVDGATRKVWLGINNTWIGSGDPANGTNEAGTVTVSNSVGYDLMPVSQNNSAGVVHFNFGADSSFGGEKTSGSANASDSNSVGDFYYTPPTSFLALSSSNLSISSDIDPAQTDDDIPIKLFNAITYTGTGSNGNNITGLGFQPDLVWFKNRSNGGGAYKNNLADTNRGVTKVVYSDSGNAEETNGDITSFDSDGFSVGGSGTYVNASGQNYVAWGWRANGGTTSSNTNGSTTSTVQSNTKAGFSIISYSGNSTSGSTIGHGLNSAPDFILFKALSGSENWAVYHRGIGGTKALELNTTSAEITNSNRFNNTDPSATLITMGNVGNVNESGKNYVAYAWHSVVGYSKFGVYEGNSNADGTFVYTGFRPRLLVVKNVDASDGWVVVDTEREPHNVMGEKVLNWEGNYAEYDPANVNMDVLSNGFKLRNTDQKINTSHTFVYMAWGDVPAKYNNAF